jgi:tetratricopeptide (TPR) repeat protein
MKKYRIKIENGRVIGPFHESQVIELVKNGKIGPNSEVQVFPIGDWKNIKKFNEFSTLEFSNPSEPTIMKKLSELSTPSQKTNEENLNTKTTVFPKKENELKPFDYKSHAQDIDDKPITSPSIVKEPIAEQINNQDKTTINKSTQDYLKQLKLDAEAKKEADKHAEELQKSIDEEDVNPEATQFIKLDQLKEIKSEIDESEFELKVDKPEEIKPKENKIKKLLIPVVVLLGIAFFLMPDNSKKEEVKIVPKYPEILFPEINEVENQKKSDEAFANYQKLIQSYTYKDQLKMAKYLTESLSNKMADNPALARLIISFSDLIPHSNQRIKDGTSLFNLTQIVEPNILMDADAVTGVAKFYLQFQKAGASVKMIDQFLAIESNKPTKELFAVYLNSLIENNRIDLAKTVYEKLTAAGGKSFYIDQAKLNYEKKNFDYNELVVKINEYLKEYSGSCFFLLERAWLELNLQDYKALENTLSEIKNASAENSPLYYSKYLNYLAILHLNKNEKQIADNLIRESFSVMDTEEIRDFVSLIYQKNSETSDNAFVQEAKAGKLIKDSNLALVENNLDKAIQFSVDASEVAPESISVKIHSAKIQILQGLYQAAIDSLRALYQTYPNDIKVAFALLDFYLKSYKLQDANKLISILSNSPMGQEPEFNKLVAKYYIEKKNPSNAQNWLTKAINSNPLDDTNYFEMAKLYIDNKKFDDAKSRLSKAMKLNPLEVKYRIYYAKTLYELTDTDTAIGSLRDTLIDFPDDPEVMSEIGIYYYKSGQNKFFEEIKEKLSKMDNASKTLYQFLIKAAELDEKHEDIITYGNKLILMDPSDLQTRMLMAKTYIKQQNFKEALNLIRDVESKLNTFPLLNHQYAQLYLLTNDIPKAIEYAKKEIEGNPELEDGYVLLGNIFLKDEKFSDAEASFKKSQKLNPNSIPSIMGLGEISFKKGQLEISLELFLKVLKLQPDNLEVHRLLGDVYRHLGQGALAVESYKNYLEVNPNSSYKSQVEGYIRALQ